MGAAVGQIVDALRDTVQEQRAKLAELHAETSRLRATVSERDVTIAWLRSGVSVRCDACTSDHA